MTMSGEIDDAAPRAGMTVSHEGDGSGTLAEDPGSGGAIPEKLPSQDNERQEAKTANDGHDRLDKAREVKKPSVWALVKAKTAALGLNVATLGLMFKSVILLSLFRDYTASIVFRFSVTDEHHRASLPPIISVCICQSDPIAKMFTTLGYEIAVISVLAMAILPRGKYLQTLTLNILAVCMGAAIALLILWSGIQARKHTSGPLTPAQASAEAAGARPPYNSSQSAVCGVWLFFVIWMVNVIRAKFPSFNIPAIIASILMNISATNGPGMASTAQAEALVKELMTSMLLALGIATGVSLLIFPVSSRMVVKGQFTALIGLLRKVVEQQKTYLYGLEAHDMFNLELVETAVGGNDRADKGEQKAQRKKAGKKNKKAKSDEGEENDDEESESTEEECDSAASEQQQAAHTLKETISTLRAMLGKLQGELMFAKRDAAWGKLSGKDLGEIYKLIRNIAVPM